MASAQGGFSTGNIEFEYAGPDSNRFVVAFLREIAPIVGDADGEVRCEATSDDAVDPTFEFYKFQGGASPETTREIGSRPS